MKSIRLVLLATAAAAVSSCSSPVAPTLPPTNTATADPDKFDIANVRLGMDADQAMAALRQTYGQSVMDLRVRDQSILDVVKIARDMSYSPNKIYYSMKLSTEADPKTYPNHIFYNIQDP